MRLAEVAHIGSGLTARKRLEPEITGGAPVIQLRDVQPGFNIVVDKLDRVELEKTPNKFAVRGGELIFRSRGAPNVAIIVSPSDEPAAVVSPLFIVRPRPDMVLPDYLAWAINRPTAQRYFDGAAQGGTIRMIPKAALEQLEIPLPNRETQHLIVEAHAIAEREAALSHELADLRRQLTHLTLEERARSAPQKEAQA